MASSTLLGEVAASDESEAVGADAAKSAASDRPAREILRIGWPIAVSGLVYWCQSFFTVWLIAHRGDGDEGTIFMVATAH